MKLDTSMITMLFPLTAYIIRRSFTATDPVVYGVVDSQITIISVHHIMTMVIGYSDITERCSPVRDYRSSLTYITRNSPTVYM